MVPAFSMAPPDGEDWLQSFTQFEEGTFVGQAHWEVEFPEGSDGWRYRWSTDEATWTEFDGLDGSNHPQSDEFPVGTTVYGQAAFDLGGVQVSDWSASQTTDGTV